MATHFPAGTIAVPSYLWDDGELVQLREKLEPFATGDSDYTDEPCERAASAVQEINNELRKRGTFGT